MSARTLFDKVWTAHEVVPETVETPAVLYIDLRLIHEVTSPQAFSLLKSLDLRVRRPDRTLATMDHSTPTVTDQVFGKIPIKVDAAAKQVRQLESNAAEFGVELFDMRDARRGIVHVISPELGCTQPGMTIVCGDSHTTTHGAFGALAFGIGTTETEHVLLTQTLIQARSKNMRAVIDGPLPPQVSAKDLILAIIGEIGAGGATGYALEFTGAAITRVHGPQRRRIGHRHRDRPGFHRIVHQRAHRGFARGRACRKRQDGQRRCRRDDRSWVGPGETTGRGRRAGQDFHRGRL